MAWIGLAVLLVTTTAHAFQGGGPAPLRVPDQPGAPVPGAPAFRQVGKGEQRVEGLLQRIVCSRRGVEFVMRLPNRVARFQAASIERVEFISHRKGVGGNVTCGGRTPPDRVYLTSRPGPLDGTAVAVEFLPEK